MSCLLRCAGESTSFGIKWLLVAGRGLVAAALQEFRECEREGEGKNSVLDDKVGRALRARLVRG